LYYRQLPGGRLPENDFKGELGDADYYKIARHAKAMIATKSQQLAGGRKQRSGPLRSTGRLV